MTRQIHRFPLSWNTDLTRISGGAVTVCHEDGSQTHLDALPVPVPGEILVWVRVRCAACGSAVVGEVQEWVTPTGTRVVCFLGTVYARKQAGEDERLVAFTSAALLEPASNTEPATMCRDHGPLRVTRRLLSANVAQGRYLAATARDQPSETAAKATQRIKCAPTDPTWRVQKLPPPDRRSVGTRMKEWAARHGES